MIASKSRIFHYENMPRPRTLDPIGASDNPNIIDDPERQAEILDRAIDRLKHLERGYTLAKSALRSDRLTFNNSLTRLREQLARIDRDEWVEFEQSQDNRLHPELELLINCEARKRAELDPSALLGPDHERHIMAAARHVASIQIPRRGRPRRQLFEHYFKGLVALWIEVTGTPVVGQRTLNSVYHPHLPGAPGKVVRAFADHVEPRITDTALVNMLGRIRRKYAGKAMRFQSLFPGYGGSVVDGVPHPGPGYRLESFVPIIPIYCP